jgi:hypothetical protein
MAGLVPAIHVFGRLGLNIEDVDARNKSAHDAREDRKLASDCPYAPPLSL